MSPADDGAQALLRVHLAPNVVTRFKSEEGESWERLANLLAIDIKGWKVVGADGIVFTQTSFAFGRDRSNNIDAPAYAWHAHMTPTGRQDRVRWTEQVGGPSFARTSDLVMVYSLADDTPQYGCLVLGIFGEEPEGHRIWEKAFDRIRRNWEGAAQKHQDTGWLPANTVTY